MTNATRASRLFASTAGMAHLELDHRYHLTLLRRRMCYSENYLTWPYGI